MSQDIRRQVAITGATGYLGRALTTQLIQRGHDVCAVVRPGSERRAAPGVRVVAVDVMNAADLAATLLGRDTVVHLIGTPHPSPAKAKEFIRVDLASVQACVAAAVRAGVGSFVYVSVAHPAPVMRAYIDARIQAERTIVATRMAATILRPWYVLGPGHRWPVVLEPIYALAALIPATRAGAIRLGLVTLAQMVRALVAAVEDPPQPGAPRILGVPEIRRAAG